MQTKDIELIIRGCNDNSIEYEKDYAVHITIRKDSYKTLGEGVTDSENNETLSKQSLNCLSEQRITVEKSPQSKN
jgi:hypothetical protein